ncbi:MerR family transcriptional regulator [Microbispora sp. RL4-1S]|uniref:MerR family transcriptional regulator n=1 Tax=Microbispora oryzae TaxID=2806554 RepID=A0A941AN81_9ACTN|nr:MerR family transcriptional regulator [Microbispora oryzae]MBP2702449.1 MerR family transcriptional regulator [Microbispora oryzae]
MSETWTISELAERAASLLGPESHVNGRVREVPNERLIRWYTTIGLLDPPLTRRGRVAIYGRRHLLQLLAVKRRQAEGQSIAAIQVELAGAPDSVLERLAGRVYGITGPTSASPGAAEPAASPAPGRFWTRAPVPAAPEADPPAAASTAPAAATAAGDVRPPAHDVVTGVRLAPGVTVLLDAAGRAPTHDDVAVLRAAAEPLLATLAALGLAEGSDRSEGMTP